MNCQYREISFQSELWSGALDYLERLEHPSTICLTRHKWAVGDHGLTSSECRLPLCRIPSTSLDRNTSILFTSLDPVSIRENGSRFCSLSSHVWVLCCICVLCSYVEWMYMLWPRKMLDVFLVLLSVLPPSGRAPPYTRSTVSASLANSRICLSNCLYLQVLETSIRNHAWLWT